MRGTPDRLYIDVDVGDMWIVGSGREVVEMRNHSV